VPCAVPSRLLCVVPCGGGRGFFAGDNRRSPLCGHPPSPPRGCTAAAPKDCTAAAGAVWAPPLNFPPTAHWLGAKKQRSAQSRGCRSDNETRGRPGVRCHRNSPRVEEPVLRFTYVAAFLPLRDHFPNGVFENKRVRRRACAENR